MKTFHIISIKVIRKFFFIFLNIKLFNYWCQDGYINLNNNNKKKKVVLEKVIMEYHVNMLTEQNMFM